MRKIIALLFCFITSQLYSQSLQIDNPIEIPVFNYRVKYFQRNDTIFQYRIYPEKGIIDSVTCTNIYLKQKKFKWIGETDADNSYSVSKFRKVKTSEWFKENNKWFNADVECELKAYKRFYPDGRIQKYWRFGTISHSRIIEPKNKK